MFFKSLVNLHKYRKFDYRSRYYDETREKYDELRVQKGMKEYSGEQKSSGKSISFSRRYEAKGTTNNRANFRIVFIFALLCIAVYIILMT
jgi:hypothetical protein